MKACIICAPGVEECEALLVYDILFRAEVDVKLIGFNEEITSSHNVTFKVNGLLDKEDLNDYDCLILPGGMPGKKNLEESPIVQKTIDDFMRDNKLIAALCSAPSILIKKGLLKDKEFTCFPGFEEGLEKLPVKAHKCRNIITGCGLGGTIDFASLIVEELVSKEKADEILNRIGY